MSEDATGKPPEYREFSLFFEPPNPKMDVNYMRDVLKDEWDISKLELPIYFYQPDVEPSPEGGRVKTVRWQDDRPKKRALHTVTLEESPEQQPWVLFTRDGRKYVATPDTLNDRAVLYQQDRGFTVQLVSGSLRVAEERRGTIQDVDAAASRKRKEDEEIESQRRKIGSSQLVNEIVQEARERKVREAERVKMELDAGSDQDDGAKKSGDDSGVHGVDIETDDGVDKEDDSEPESIDISLSSANSEGSDEYDDEEEEKKEEPVKKPVRNTGETAESVLKKIYEDQVKEEELLCYLREMGLVTERDLIAKFRDRLKTPTQKEAFKKLFKRRCQYHTVGDGVKMIRLKTKTQ